MRYLDSPNVVTGGEVSPEFKIFIKRFLLDKGLKLDLTEAEMASHNVAAEEAVVWNELFDDFRLYLVSCFKDEQKVPQHQHCTALRFHDNS